MINLLLCGSFNPITKRHLQIIDLAVQKMTQRGILVKQIFLSPVNDLYYLQKPTLAQTPGPDRIKMIKLALQDHISINPDHRIRLHLWEYLQDDWQLTKNVLQKIRKEFPEPLYLLCGADLLVSMNNTKYWNPDDIDLISSQYGIVCLDRNQCNLEEEIQKNPSLSKNKNKIHILDLEIDQRNDISSTQIRKNISENKWDQVEPQLYPSVLKYIQNHQLFL